MICHLWRGKTPSSGVRAMTLIELMVAIAAGLLVIVAAVSAWVFILRSFTAVGNYADLDGKSRYTVDSMLAEIRQDNQVVSFQKSSSNCWLSLTNALIAGGDVKYSWDSASRQLVRQRSGWPDRVYLTECDMWDFEFYQRTPNSNGVYSFFPATNSSGVTDASICKLINMTWKCSRQILGKKVNTENVQTAQVVLRNKQ
jgi:hypothetical protein